MKIKIRDVKCVRASTCETCPFDIGRGNDRWGLLCWLMNGSDFKNIEEGIEYVETVIADIKKHLDDEFEVDKDECK